MSCGHGWILSCTKCGNNIFTFAARKDPAFLIELEMRRRYLKIYVALLDLQNSK